MDNNNKSYYNDINNIDEINSNGAELKEFIKNNKDIESNNNESKYWNHENNSNNNIDNSHDFSYSLILLLLGIVFVLPFFFNIVYIKSNNKHARRIAMASIIIGSMYFVTYFILMNITWFAFAL